MLSAMRINREFNYVCEYDVHFRGKRYHRQVVNGHIGIDNRVLNGQIDS